MQATRSHRFPIKSVLFLIVLAGLFSCKTYSEDDKTSFDQKIGKYIGRKGWKMNRSDSGLYSQQLAEGQADAEAIQYNSEVTLKYKGKLLNGSTVDQSLPGKPLTSGLRGLIGGFQEGLLGQKKGAKVRLVIPPQLGYGNDDYGKIPASSVLVFEIEVVDVR